jgi:methyltransferase
MTAFELFLVGIGVERLLELVLSKRHERTLLSEGQAISVEPMFILMVAVHAGVLIASALEVRLGHRPFDSITGYLAIALFLGATGLRWWTIQTLGEQWTVRVISGQKLRVRTEGPFRYVRHPNYLGVLLEVVAIPLIHGAYVSAIFFGLLNLWVVLRRIRLEESALGSQSDYGRSMNGRARLIPGIY